MKTNKIKTRRSKLLILTLMLLCLCIVSGVVVVGMLSAPDNKYVVENEQTVKLFRPEDPEDPTVYYDTLIGFGKTEMLEADPHMLWFQEIEMEIFDNTALPLETLHDGNPKVIAPGTNGKYTVTMENTDYFAVSYRFKLWDINDRNIPMHIKVKRTFKDSGEEKWILGGEDSWVDLENAELWSQTWEWLASGRFPHKNKVVYEIFWEWPYEGHDQSDTKVGTNAKDYYLKYLEKGEENVERDLDDFTWYDTKYTLKMHIFIQRDMKDLGTYQYDELPNPDFTPDDYAEVGDGLGGPLTVGDDAEPNTDDTSASCNAFSSCAGCNEDTSGASVPFALMGVALLTVFGLVIKLRIIK